MFEEVLARIQGLFRRQAYIVTLHADEEMDNDGLDLRDIEQVLLSGQIIEQQRDIHTPVWKYLILGHTHDDIDVVVVVKISPLDTVVIITVYRA